MIDFFYLFEIIIICIIFKLVFSNNSSKIETDDDKVIFKLSEKLKNFMLILTIIFALFLIIYSFTSLSDNDDGIAVFIILILIFMFLIYIYLYSKNFKIIYKDKKFYHYNILGKETIFDIGDITKVIIYSSNGLKVYFKNNKKLNFEAIMINFEKIKDILDNNGIVYKDKSGYKSPKGW